MKVFLFVISVSCFLLTRRCHGLKCSDAGPPKKTSVSGSREYAYFSEMRGNFHIADCVCASWNGFLAMIKDNETQKHLEDHLPKSLNRSFFYIGLSQTRIFGNETQRPKNISKQEIDACRENKVDYVLRNHKWVWPDGSSLKNRSFENWNKRKDICYSQPNGNVCCNGRVTDRRPVVQISNKVGETFGKWFSKPYVSSWYVICERSYTSTVEQETSQQTKISEETTFIEKALLHTTVFPNTVSATATVSSTFAASRESSNGTSPMPSSTPSSTTEFMEKVPGTHAGSTTAKIVFDRMEKAISLMINDFSLRYWETFGAKSLAEQMLQQNETKNKTFHRLGSVIKVAVVVPVSPAFTNSTLLHSIKFSKESADEFKFDNSQVKQPSVIVSGSFSNQVWKNIDLDSVSPSKPLELENQAQNIDFTQHVLPLNTSVLSFSMFARSRSQAVLEKINVALESAIDARNDHTAAMFQKYNRIIVPGGLNPVCVFVDTSDETKLRWSSTGCRVASGTGRHVRCFCNHTTSFGVLFAVRSITVPTGVNMFITAAEVVSTVALALTSSLLLWLRRRLHSDRTWIQINLSISLLLLHFFFLLGTVAIQPTTSSLCVAVAVLSHFFTISSAVWMLSEGFVLYMKTCKNAMKFSLERIQRRLIVAGWTIPCLYVGVCAAAGLTLGAYMDESTAYTQEKSKGFTSGAPVAKYDRCWLGFTRKMVYSAIVPLFAIFLTTTAILIRTSLAIKRMTEKALKLRPQNALPKNTRLHSESNALRQARLALNSAITLVPVLGVPWLFAFLVNVPSAEVCFIIIHGILNGFQGLFVFLVYCVKNEKFRQVLQRKWKETPKSTQTFTFNRHTSTGARSPYATRHASKSNGCQV